MMISILRFGPGAVIGSLVLLIGHPRRGHSRRPPIPPFTGERVIVAGVPDQYASLAGQIARLEKASPQSYYVVVVKSTGTGSSATRDYADRTVRKLAKAAIAARPIVRPREVGDHRRGPREPSGRRQTRHDASRSVRAARRAGRARSDPGISSTWHARTGITEAIASLLDATNNWIAARDRETPYVAVQVPASKSAGRPPKTAKATSKVPVPSPKSSPVQSAAARSSTSSRPSPRR